MIIHLKVKICTLASEAKIIHQQEQRLVRQKCGIFVSGKTELPFTPTISQESEDFYRKQRIQKKLWKAKVKSVKTGPVWASLHNHRRNEVRKEARHSQLAYAFLRERPYFLLEKTCYTQPDWVQVEKIIKRFAGKQDIRVLQQRFEEWKQSGRQDQSNCQDGKAA